MQIIKENIIENRNEVIVDTYFQKVKEYLRKSIYPKLDDENMYELNIRLKKWFNDNVPY